MPTICFIYKIHDSPITYYGKYRKNYISDDHEGLDREILPTIFFGLNVYRKKQGLPILEKNELKLGIISCSTNRNCINYSTDDEISCFDFYYYHEKRYIASISESKMKEKYFIHGTELDVSGEIRSRYRYYDTTDSDDDTDSLKDTHFPENELSI